MEGKIAGRICVGRKRLEYIDRMRVVSIRCNDAGSSGYGEIQALDHNRDAWRAAPNLLLFQGLCAQAYIEWIFRFHIYTLLDRVLVINISEFHRCATGTAGSTNFPAHHHQQANWISLGRSYRHPVCNHRCATFGKIFKEKVTGPNVKLI